MLQAERHHYILETLESEKSVSITKLCEQLKVTRQTIRKDLEILNDKGKLKKVHGGAVLKPSMAEPSITVRKEFNLKEKEAIAKKAACYIKEGDTIYLDIGTTINKMIPYVARIPRVTVITNSVYAAYHLGDSQNTKVILCGGEMRSGELSLSGPLTRQTIENYYVDKCFIGIGGFSAKTGYSDYHIAEADIRKIIIDRSNHSFALMDHSKFNTSAFVQFGHVEDIDTVITDENAPQEALQFLRSSNVKVEVVAVQ